MLNAWLSDCAGSQAELEGLLTGDVSLLELGVLVQL
jgi:hypothetical protein